MSETHWKKLTDPNFLGSYDFQKSEERTLIIKVVKQEEVYNPNANKKEICLVAHFSNSKPMILNKTNAKMITKLYDTPFIEQWQGKAIIVGVDKVKAKGELVEALRIRNKKPQQQQAPQPKIYTCGDCSKPVTDFAGYTAEQIALANQKKYNDILCATCSTIRKQKESELINESESQ